MSLVGKVTRTCVRFAGAYIGTLKFVQDSAVWRSYIQRNCRYFSFRASVSRLGFAPRVLRLLHLSGIHLKYPIVGATIAELHSIAQH
jgi:hypothetical protein